MAYPIPEPYCWDESFAVFYQNLDEEHKGLFQGIFKCAANPADGGALSALAKAVKDHFTNEEGMMSKAGYADFAAHKVLHDDFLATLGSLSAPLSADNVNFAKNWLVQHIKSTDHQYKGKL